VEIAATECGECEIGTELCEWLNVGIVEKPGANSVNVELAPKSFFTVNSLFSDLATVVHSVSWRAARLARQIEERLLRRARGGFLANHEA
jgi:hypothetical protein